MDSNKILRAVWAALVTGAMSTAIFSDVKIALASSLTAACVAFILLGAIKKPRRYIAAMATAGWLIIAATAIGPLLAKNGGTPQSAARLALLGLLVFWAPAVSAVIALGVGDWIPRHSLKRRDASNV